VSIPGDIVDLIPALKDAAIDWYRQSKGSPSDARLRTALCLAVQDTLDSCSVADTHGDRIFNHDLARQEVSAVTRRLRELVSDPESDIFHLEHADERLSLRSLVSPAKGSPDEAGEDRVSIAAKTTGLFQVLHRTDLREGLPMAQQDEWTYLEGKSSFKGVAV
jgi:hypothetical protein